MNIKIYQDRRLLSEDNNFGSENENLATTLVFEFPEYIEKDGVQISTKDLNKTIIFDIEGDNELPIYNDKFSFPYEITKLGEVVWNICLKEKSETEEMTDKLIWYSETMKTRFINTLEGHNEITTEKIDAFNVITSILNEKIAEVETLKVDIGDYKAALDNKVDKEQGKGLSTNDFTNILKEKLDNLENYNDAEIRNLLNGSLKNVNYTASNGMLTFTKNDGSTLSVDLPLELLIESGRYDEANKQIVLVLANGNSINIPVSSLLDDFYGKNETYNKTEVDTIIAEKQALIDKLEEENQKQQEELDILNSEYTEKELEGESVVISNGLPKSKIKVKGNGNSYQETTEGYNLVNESSLSNYTNVTTINGNVVTSASTTNEGASNVGVSFEGFEIEAGDYYISVDARIISGSVESISSLQMLGDNLTVSSTEWINKPTLSNEFKRVIRKYTISSVNNTVIKRMLLQVSKPTNAVLELKDFQISKVNKPYEPYTNGVATPNTNHKQDIEEIDMINRLDVEQLTKVPTTIGTTFDKKTGWLKIENTRDAQSYVNIQVPTKHIIGGKSYTLKVEFADTNRCNVFLQNASSDYSKVMGANGSVTNTAIDDYMNVLVTPQANQTVTVRLSLADEKINLDDLPYLPYGHIGLVQRGKNEYKTYGEGYLSNTDGSITINATRIASVTDFIPKRNNKVYLVNEKYDSSVTNTWVYRIGLYDKNKKWITNKIIEKIDYTHELDENVAFIKVSIPLYLEETQYVSFIDNQYEPYIEPIVHPIDLAGNSIAKVGEIADLLNIGVDGRVSIDKKIVNFTTQLEAQAFDNDLGYRLYRGITEDTQGTQVLSDKFKYHESAGVLSYYGLRLNSALKALVGLAPNLSIGDIVETEIYAQRAETEVIDLPSIEPIELFEGTNIFELVTNLGTTLAVTYKVSNKARLKALENAILSLGGNV